MMSFQSATAYNIILNRNVCKNPLKFEMYHNYNISLILNTNLLFIIFVYHCV